MSHLIKVSAMIIVICCGLFGSAYGTEDTDGFGQLLDKIKTYDFGKSRVDLIKISDMIRQASGKPEIKEIEKQLDEFLKSNPTYAAKDFVCRELSVIGTEASVPALTPMLMDPNTSDIARYALERIPGEAVDTALREALGAATGNAKIGIINTLGVRGDKKAVGALTELASDSNEAVACAAIASLGRIDDPAAVEAIAKIKDKATGSLKTNAMDSYLRQADMMLAKGQKDEALAIYKQLNVSSEPMPIRIAAARGMIMSSGDKTAETVTEFLKSPDKQIQTAAIETLRDVPKTDVVKAAAEQLPNLAATQQIQLLTALADCKDKAALPAVLEAAKSSDEQVRIMSLNTLGILGDVATVDVLVKAAAETKGNEQKAAQESLYRLKGEDVDKAILKKLTEAEPKAKVELVRSCDQRNIVSAVPLLLNTAKDADPTVRMESIKALRNLAGPDDMTALVELQMAASGADRTELEKTVVAVAKKIPADKNPAKAVLDALPKAKDLDTRSSLLSVLGRIGDPAGLTILREALSDKDEKVKEAAVRGLSEWPTSAPAEDLLKVAKESENQLQKTLALRGYVRLIGLESEKPPEEIIKMYKEAMAIAPNAAEKKMVLSGLANMQSVEALQMAGEYLADSDLKQEAEAAVVKIAESTIRKDPRQTRELLQKVLDGNPGESVKEQAQRLLRPQRQ
jgi:HEAT repeat protein